MQGHCGFLLHILLATISSMSAAAVEPPQSVTSNAQALQQRPSDRQLGVDDLLGSPTTVSAPKAEEEATKLYNAHNEGRRMSESESTAAFECNVCLELCKEPVVTLCGHLYCWPCLYRWLQVQSYCRACPVCKAGVDVDKVIPIYGRGSEADASLQEPVKAIQPVPPRPAGQRPAIVQQASPQPNGQQSMLPALFGFQLGPGQGYVEALAPEQQHQAFLSRLLLMLGSFVIMCLLLF